jgi:hypothetical protein
MQAEDDTAICKTLLVAIRLPIVMADYLKIFSLG